MSADLARIYVQVDYATDSYETLGIAHLHAPTSSEVKSAYRSLALLLHPDKAPNECLVAAHTRFFLKLQEAQDKLLNGDEEDGTAPALELKALVEGPISLHQRNCDFKTKLRNARDVAIKAKHTEDGRKAKAKKAAGAKLQHQEWEEECHLARERTKYAKLADKFDPNHITDAIQILKELAKQTKRSEKSAAKHAKKVARDFNEPKKKTSGRGRDLDEGRKLQGMTVAAAIEASDIVLATEEDIEHRWHKELLSGNPANVSLEEKKRRDNNMMAKELAIEKWLYSEYDRHLKFAYAKARARGERISFFSTQDQQIQQEVWSEVASEANQMLRNLRVGE